MGWRLQLSFAICENSSIQCEATVARATVPVLYQRGFGMVSDSAAGMQPMHARRSPWHCVSVFGRAFLLSHSVDFNEGIK